MTEGRGRTVISVRGEAREVVPPDSVAFSCEVTAVADGAVVARERVARVRSDLIAALDGVGSVVATVDTRREPLSHLVHALSVEEHYEHDAAGNGRRRDRAGVSIVVTVRDFARLPSVLDELSGRDGVSVSSTWAVDEDNPAWARLRGEAVTMAVSRASQYAAALGGSVTGVPELADGGLLTGGGPEHAFAARSVALGLTGGGQLWLDPVPQELRAVVEARCVPEVPPMSNG